MQEIPETDYCANCGVEVAETDAVHVWDRSDTEYGPIELGPFCSTCGHQAQQKRDSQR